MTARFLVVVALAFGLGGLPGLSVADAASGSPVSTAPAYMQAQARGLLSAGIELRQFIRPGRMNVAFVRLLLPGDQGDTLAGLSYLLPLLSPPPCLDCRIINDEAAQLVETVQAVLEFLNTLASPHGCFMQANIAWSEIPNSQFVEYLVTGESQVWCDSQHITDTVILHRLADSNDAPGSLSFTATTTCLQSGGYCDITVNNNTAPAEVGSCWITQGNGVWTKNSGDPTPASDTVFSAEYCFPV